MMCLVFNFHRVIILRCAKKKLTTDVYISVHIKSNSLTSWLIAAIILSVSIDGLDSIL